jgi:hypothetical protein
MAYDDSLMLVKAVLKTDGIDRFTTTLQITHVESGVLYATIMTKQNHLKVGDSFYIAPNVPLMVQLCTEGVLDRCFQPDARRFRFKIH